MIRAIWTGALSFGLVNIPVKLYSAIKERGINFDLLHEKDLSPVRYAKVCKKEGDEIPYEEIVRGYEYEKDHYVTITEEDMRKVDIGATKTIQILNFSEEKEVDPILVERPYYLQPIGGSEKPYLLLMDSLDKLNKVGIGKYVLRNKEHLVMIKPYNGLLILLQLRFLEEIKDSEPVKSSIKFVENLSKEELGMAEALVNQLTKSFNPKDYHDKYYQEIINLIEDKIAGKIPSKKGFVPEPTKVPDLMEMLKKSLEEEKKKEKVKT